MSGWKIIRITDETTTCEVCGRVELKSTTLIECADGSQLWAGSSCAARKVGVKAAEMRGAIKAYRMRLEVARCNFPDYFRAQFGMTVEAFIRNNPNRRKVAEMRYRNYMHREGFTV
jgi:hypothetical protein